MDRSVDYARQLLQNEEYLSILYKCTAEEVKARREESLDPQLLNSPFWTLQPKLFDENDPSFDSTTFAQRYNLWKDFEDSEYQRRLQIIADIRQRLIESSTSVQKQRMFRRELKEALERYGQQDWDMASSLFDRLLNDFGYKTLDDILFYQSEVNYKLKYYEAALNTIFQLLQQYPQSQFRPRCYDRGSEILTRLGKGRELINFANNYLNEGAPGDPAQMGGIYVRAAHAEMDIGHYQPAIDILGKVSAKSPYYLASRYLLADCLSALKDWPGSIQVLNDMVNMKQGALAFDRWRMLTDEARIKLAYTYYENGEYDKAADLFSAVNANSPFFDRAMLGKAWISFQLDNYQEAIGKTEEMLNFYPLSTEIYEAGSLAGYCYEQMGDKTTAMGYFLDVLEAGVGRSRLQNFLEEKRRISDALSELESLEMGVFTSANEQVYREYRRARDLLQIGLKRIDLAQLLEANSQMRGLVAERVILDSLLNVQFKLVDQIDQSKNRHLMGEFVILEDRIYNMLGRLNTIGQEKVKQTPLYYQEAQIGYINSVADSLSAQIERETANLVSASQKTDQLRQQAVQSGRLEQSLKISTQLDGLDNSLDQTYLNHALSEASRRPVLKTRVDRWSDFSFNRYAMGGLEFDELQRKYDRIERIEEYISRLDDILQRRQSQTAPADSQTPQSP
ncbi:MAG: tetratricopeptide repeat protein [bacterium]|nr:tetratricopeptide repeat protein [bacterium]